MALFFLAKKAKVLPLLPLLFSILSPCLSVVFSDASDSSSNLNPTYSYNYGCGSLNFSYPFSEYNSESNATAVCGYPDLRVLCNDGIHPLLPLGSTNFSIGNIDVDRSIIHLANPDTPDTSYVSYCPTITHGITLPSESILDKTTNDVDLTFLYGCDGALPPSFIPIPFLTRSYIFVGTNLPSGHNYDGMCSQIVKTVAIVPPASLQSINTTFSMALLGGFDLTWKWNSAECKHCEQSGGWCSYTQSDRTFFTCFNSSQDCRTHCLLSTFLFIII